MGEKSVRVNPNRTLDGLCPSVIQYSGSVCRDVLHAAYSNCDLPPEQTTIFTAVDASVQAAQLLGGLRAFASPECVEVVIPFLCLHLFGGVCDEDGLQHLPTISECVDISTGPCSKEWELARTFGFPLPNCDTFPSVKQRLSCSNTSQELQAVGKLAWLVGRK